MLEMFGMILSRYLTHLTGIFIERSLYCIVFHGDMSWFERVNLLHVLYQHVTLLQECLAYLACFDIEVAPYDGYTLHFDRLLTWYTLRE
jgi:hypothetical protein